VRDSGGFTVALCSASLPVGRVVGCLEPSSRGTRKTEILVAVTAQTPPRPASRGRLADPLSGAEVTAVRLYRAVHHLAVPRSHMPAG
jgi:hypothetical protein